MVKVLSQAGISLSDVYDVEGSIAGTEQLDAREVQLVHEMGGTIFSERLGARITRVETAALSQSSDFDFVVTDLPEDITRIVGITVLATNAGRVGHCNVAARDGQGGREMPLWAFDFADDAELNIRIQEDGAAVANTVFLRPLASVPALPSLLVNVRIPGTGAVAINELTFRGSTRAFGAGTVTLVALIHMLFTHTTSLSSYGLPVPSW